MPDTLTDSILEPAGLEQIGQPPRFPRFVTVGKRSFFRLYVEGKDHEIELSAAQVADMQADMARWMAALLRMPSRA